MLVARNIRQTASHLVRNEASMALQVGRWHRSTRGLATPSRRPYDAVVIGGVRGNFIEHSN